MEREKQIIEEMAKTILKGELDRNRGDLDITEFSIDLIVKVGMQRVAGATALYNAGYRKERQGEWISVEDRLPETEGDYLVWNKEQRRIEKRFFYRLPPHYPVESHPEIREYFGDISNYKKITHWMPLPTPPKMKGVE